LFFYRPDLRHNIPSRIEASQLASSREIPMLKRIEIVLERLPIVATALLCLSVAVSASPKDKIVFVRADPTTGVQSIQQITDPNEFAATNELGVSKDHHDAPQFQATSARDPRKNELGLMNTDGSGVAFLHVFGTDPALSPDGTKIAYCSLKETQYFQIFVMNADGTGSRRLTNWGSGDACGPAWSRDGKRIAFYAFAI